MATDHPEDLRRRLTLLEGDKKAYYESSQASMKSNKEVIVRLRRETKAMAAKLKALKTPSAQPGGNTGRLELRVKDQIKRHNTLRHDAVSKLKQMEVLRKKIAQLEKEAGMQTDSPELQRLRTIENRLDKTQIKTKEATHIATTYREIISKLEKERTTYDGKVDAMEKAIKTKKHEIADLESMYNDSVLARDIARQELAAKELEHNSAKSAREQEKKELDTIAEERRRQYEAIEKRLRHASAVSQRAVPEVTDTEAIDEGAQDQLAVYEAAMQRIKDATGVSGIDAVVERFSSQRDTQGRLKGLQKENLEKLDKLRQEHDKLTKQFESLKYSGEARNTSNQRMLKEFGKHLKDAEDRLATAQEAGDRSSQLLVKVQAGVDHLHYKLAKLKPVQFRAANNVHDKLTEAELRLTNLKEELEARKAELPDNALEAPSVMVLPEHNTRIHLPSLDADADDDSESEDDEVISRDALKRQAQSLVDSKTKKKRGGGGGGGKRKGR